MLSSKNNRKRLIEYVLKDAVLDDVFLASLNEYIPFDNPARFVGDNVEAFASGKIQGLQLLENGEFIGHILYTVTDAEFHWLSASATSKIKFNLSPEVFEYVKEYAKNTLGCATIRLDTIRRPIVDFVTKRGGFISAVTLTTIL